MAADWPKIRTEYITSPKKVSYRKLAKKYGVSESAVFGRASAEQWVMQREQFQSETDAKTLDAISTATADKAAELSNAAMLLLERTTRGIKVYDTLPATAAKNYSDALKNIREILMIRSDDDVAEQKARIAKLVRESERADTGSQVTVVIDGDCSYGE